MDEGHWVYNNDWNDNFGPRGGNMGSVPTYVDTNPVIAYPGQVMTGFGFYFAGNRLFPQIRTQVVGQDPHWQPRSWYNKDNPNYFPNKGCSGIGDSGDCTYYVDTTQVMAPPGKVAVGAALMNVVGNRVGPALLCVNAATLASPQWIFNTQNNGSYFEKNSNLGRYYVDTNPISAPTGWVVTGVALSQKNGGNRIAPDLFVVPWSSFVK